MRTHLKRFVSALTFLVPLWASAQLPFSFSGNAGDACVPPADPFYQSWPGTLDPSSSVRFAWSATNNTNDPVQLVVSVYRNTIIGPPTVLESVVHSFVAVVAPNSTTTGENIWPCAYNSFQQGLAHSVRVSGPSGTCTAFSMSVENSPGAFADDAEPNNSSSQYVTAAHNTYYEGHLRYNGTTDSDWYRIALPINGTLRIEFEGEQPSASINEFVGIEVRFTSSTIRYSTQVPLGSIRVPLATNVDIPCMGSELVYDLRFTGNGACDISYRFRYVVIPGAFPTDLEPNNGTPGSGGSPIAHDTYQDGQIGFDAQTGNDLFNIIAPTNGVMNFEVLAEHAGSVAGSMNFGLYTSAGTLIQSWSIVAGPNGIPATNTFAISCLGNTTDYDVSITGVSCGVSYRWKYTMSPPVFADDVEPNGSTGSAIVLPEATQATGHLNFNAGENNDYYRINVPDDGVLHVTIEAEHSGASTTETLGARISLSTSATLATWNAAVGANSTPTSTSYSFNCRTPGVNYYLNLVSNVCGASYRVSWTITPPVYANDVEPNSSNSSATPMDLNNAAFPGHLGFTTDDDIYIFSHPGGPWSITVSAEHAGIGTGSLSMAVRTLPTSLIASFSVPAGGSSVPETNTFTIPSLGAGTYRLHLYDVTCGVSYRIHCYDNDGDGTCNGFDLCAGGPEPGSPCNDNNANTVGDVVMADCQCVGQADADADGIADTADNCPNDPNPLQEDDDEDGIGNACDACPLAVEGIANFNVNSCACELGYFATIADIDGNEVITACSICPLGTYCPDGILSHPCPAGSYMDVEGASACAPCLANTYNPYEGQTACLACPNGESSEMGAIACTPDGDCTDYILELQNDANPGGVTWEVLDQTGTTTLESGTDLFPADAIGTQTICLPDGCYQLRVTDNAGDGLLGYVLRETGVNGRRIIDNTANMNTGVSQIANGGTFCLPMGEIGLIHSNCDKMDWVSNKYLVCHADPAVSAVWVPGGANNVQSGGTGYAFWIFDPNGSYSFRRFHAHNTSDGFSPAGPYRAAHLKLNGWSNSALTPHVPANVLMNVRVRPVVLGSLGEWGPACRMMIDPARAACPLVSLQDDPANTSDYSCGVTRNFGGPNSSANKIVADPPQFSPAPLAGGTGVRYQFRFRIPGENVCIVRPPQTSPTLHLNWNANSGPQLEASKTYEVEVRVSKDQGATWCVDVPSPTCDPNPVTTWGRTCNVTIGSVVMLEGASSSIATNGNGTLTMYPNPNNGEELFISLTEVAPEVNTVSVDIYDLTGKRITARTVAISDGSLNTALSLNGDVASGLYMVNITAGDKTYTERLVIQK